jgi:PAS domain S-box-containing protein
LDRWESELFKQLAVGVVVWELLDPDDDTSLRLVHVNAAADWEAGFMLAARAGEYILDIFPSMGPELLRAFAGTCRDRRRCDLPHFGVTAYPVGVRRVAVVSHDPGEVEPATERERRMRQFLDSLLEHIPAMVFVKEAGELRFERFNRAGEDLLGLPRSALIGKCDYDFFPKEQADFFIQKDREVLRRKALQDIPEEPIETPRGTRWLHTRKIPIVDENGEPTHLLGLSIDITEQRMVDQLRREFYVALEAENRRVIEATRVKSEFLASMSHELRTPLNAILGFAEVLHDDAQHPLTPQQKEFVGDILSSGRHLLRLIRDILDLSKVESGLLELHPALVDVTALVAEVTNTLRLTAAEKGISVETLIDVQVHQVIVDPDRLRQILYNYLANALKFTSGGGRVQIRVTSEDEEHFRLEVEDSGIGIAATDFAKLFVDFQQLDSGAGKQYGGTGLGLALSKRLVEAQGGRVGVKSELGKGSTFHAVLPRRPRR